MAPRVRFRAIASFLGVLACAVALASLVAVKVPPFSVIRRRIVPGGRRGRPGMPWRLPCCQRGEWSLLCEAVHRGVASAGVTYPCVLGRGCFVVAYAPFPLPGVEIALPGCELQDAGGETELVGVPCAVGVAAPCYGQNMPPSAQAEVTYLEGTVNDA